MGDHKRYIGVRLYLPTGKTEIKEGGEACVDVQPNEMGVGNNSISIKSKREQYKDSRLAILRSGSGYYLYLMSKLAALSIASAFITAVSEDWKGYISAAMVFVIGSAFIVRAPVIKWLERYWR